jgi:hypothetical protein
MIVPSYTDERILQELMDDWPGVKRNAKKLGNDVMIKTMMLVPRMGKHFDHYREKVVPMYP